MIAIAVADDAFLHPEPGTSAADHLASGLISITIAVLAALAYPRLRPGLRAGIALIFGALALEAGIVDGIRHVLISTVAGDDKRTIKAGTEDRAFGQDVVAAGELLRQICSQA